MFVYADNAATTKMSKTAIDAMLPYMETYYGNPSSLHSVGQKAAEALQSARERIAACLGCQPREITFTSGGSEADNQALLSAAKLGARKGKKHIISTAFEHHAILHSLKRLEKEGFEVELLPVGETGTITAQQVRDAIRDDTCLVTIMYANNEIGSILPIAEIGAVCREKGVLFHTDAVQAAGKLPIDLAKMPVDFLALSGHKLHAPKGIGVLYVRKGTRFIPFLRGGHQERGRRAGTENAPYIVGLGAACELAMNHMTDENTRVPALRDKLEKGLLAAIPDAIVNGDVENRLPNTSNIAFQYVEGEAILLLMDQLGICASSGSACTSGSLEPSHVLRAMGVPFTFAHGSIRFSLSRYTTDTEIDYVLENLPPIIEQLRAISPFRAMKRKGADTPNQRSKSAQVHALRQMLGNMSVI